MDDARRLINRAYRDAAGFRTYWASELEAAGRRLIEPVEMENARRVLDLGAGIGVNVPLLHERAPSALVVAADYVEMMIRAAPSSAVRVCMDAQALGFADGAFDAAVLAFMLFHVPDPGRALQEAHRVLRPGARIAVGTWYASTSPFAPDEIWFAELAAHGAAAPPAAIANHGSMDSPEKVAALLDEAGFTGVETGIAELEDVMNDADEYLVRRTTLGLSSARYESLAPDVRVALLASVRSKLDGLERQDYTVIERALLAWARKP